MAAFSVETLVVVEMMKTSVEAKFFASQCQPMQCLKIGAWDNFFEFQADLSTGNEMGE